MGTALLGLGRLADLEMYGTASLSKHPSVRNPGGVPIDYRQAHSVDVCRQRLELPSMGRIHPVVAEWLPLTEARHAHEMLVGGATTGKLVLAFEPTDPNDSSA